MRDGRSRLAYPAAMLAIGAYPSPTVLEWSRALASLPPGQPPCPGFKPEDWVKTLTNARRFVDDLSG